MKNAPKYKSVPRSIKEFKTRVLKILEFGWTQYTRAKDKEGVSIDVHNKNAIKFCLMGAIERAYSYSNSTIPNIEMDFMRKLKAVLRETYNFISLTDFNDNSNTTKSKVINVVKKIPVK